MAMSRVGEAGRERSFLPDCEARARHYSAKCRTIPPSPTAMTLARPSKRTSVIMRSVPMCIFTCASVEVFVRPAMKRFGNEDGACDYPPERQLPLALHPSMQHAVMVFPFRVVGVVVGFVDEVVGAVPHAMHDPPQSWLASSMVA